MVFNILTAVDDANNKAPRPYFQNRYTRRIEQKAKEFYDIHCLGLGHKRSKEDLRILLIGLPAHGKSSTVFSLLGKSDSVSKVGPAFQEIQSGENSGRQIKIVEFQFPVKNPSSQSDTDFKEQLLHAEKKLHPGFHAVLFVIDPNRIAYVNDQFQPIIEYFGDEASDYAFVLMTFTGNEEELAKKFPDNINAKHPKLTTLTRFCKDKELYIDNKVTPQTRKDMVEDIFNYIDSENGKKLTPYFSSPFKQQTEVDEAARIDKAARKDDIDREVKAATEAQADQLNKLVISAKAAADEEAKKARDAQAAAESRLAALKERQREEQAANEAYKQKVEKKQKKMVSMLNHTS